MTDSTLPADFLSGPPPAGGIQRRYIDFEAEGMPEFRGFYAVVLDDVLSKDECAQWIQAAEAREEWKPALVNIGYNQQREDTDIRKCTRIIWDDREIVGKLWERIVDAVPECRELSYPTWTNRLGTRLEDGACIWEKPRLNERMRILRYGPGDYFTTHCDGTYVEPGTGETSYLTLHLYLNDGTTNEEGKLVGGATNFVGYSGRGRGEGKLAVNPKAGSILIFQQRNLFHEGAELEVGTKITLRTDILYKRKDLKGPNAK